MSCCSSIYRWLCGPKSTPVEEMQVTPHHERNNVASLIRVLPRSKELIDPHYDWFGAEPKMKQQVELLSPADQDSRVLREDAVIAAKMKIESQWAKVQMRETSSEAIPFTLSHAPKNFKTTDLEGTFGATIWASAINQASREAFQDRSIASEVELIVNGIELKGQFFAVCNGSNGASAVEYVEEHLVLEIQLSLQEFVSEYKEISNLVVYNALITAFANTNKFFLEDTQSQFSGTGLTGIFLLDGTIWPVNLGASRAVLSNRKIPLQLTQTAHAKDRRYHPPMLRRGAEPADLTQTTPRAFGHRHMKGTSARPKISEPIAVNSLDPDHFIVLTSKGVASVADPVQLVDKINRQKTDSLIQSARNIVYSAIHAGAEDSCTAMILQFNKPTPYDILDELL